MNKTVVLDICCANCATVSIERLRAAGYTVVGCFINDNIHPEEEYFRRRVSVEKLAKEYKLEVIYPDYHPKEWLKAVKGFEYEPERGKRCDICFEYRFSKILSLTRELGYDLFTTSLTISPHKRSNKINDIGKIVGHDMFLNMNFKSKGGYEESLQCSKDLELYRQKYCGCKFSDEARNKNIKTAKVVGQQKQDHYASVRRDKKEKETQDAIEKETFRYYSFNDYLKEEFGTTVYRLSLSAGFSCPNLDGTISNDGCIYCDNESFSSFAAEPYSIEEQINRLIESTNRRFGAEKFIAYFQTNTNTYATVDELKEIYDVIKKYDNIVGLAISTRPDCIDEEKLDMIAEYTKNYKVIIEYGLQSVHDKTLERINRGHDYKDFERAVKMTVERGILPAAHVILGLPGESKEDMLTTAKKISKLPLWGIKIHALHVVKSTVLADQYNNGDVDILSEDQYVETVCEFLKRIPKEWVILRMASDADRNYVIAPEWVQNKQQTLRKIQERMRVMGIVQGSLV